MYFRKKTSAGRVYLQIVESRRTGDQVRQHVIATLGRWDELAASGQLGRRLRSGARFAEKALVLGAAQEGTATTAEVRRIGPGLVFERLWTESGCRAAIDELAGRRKHGFDLGLAAAPTGRPIAGARITASPASTLSTCITSTAPWRGSGRRCPRRSRTGARRLRRAVPRTWWKSASSPTAATSSAVSIWCSWTPPACPSRGPAGEGTGGQTLGQHGYSKDHRPDLRQMILAVVIDGDGRAVGSEMWPGNTADVTSLVPVPAAPALCHRAALRRRRSRHDQHRDHRGAGGARSPLHPRQP